MELPPSLEAWNRSVSDEIKIISSRFHISGPGKHSLYFWRVDPGVDLQKLVIRFGGEKQSYLGPPESPRLGTR